LMLSHYQASVNVTIELILNFAKVIEMRDASCYNPEHETSRRPGAVGSTAPAAGCNTELWTLRHVADLMGSEFGVTYHPCHVRRLVGKTGWSCEKPEHRGRERDEEEIERRRWLHMAGGKAVALPLLTRAAFRYLCKGQ